MPASLQYAMTSPAFTRATMPSAREPMSASSKRSRRLPMPNAASSLPVTRVSSAHTTSALVSASSARCGISPKLPMGVGQMISLPAMLFLPIPRSSTFSRTKCRGDGPHRPCWRLYALVSCTSSLPASSTAGVAAAVRAARASASLSARLLFATAIMSLMRLSWLTSDAPGS